jgi:disulfide bond formation protein DsbB
MTIFFDLLIRFVSQTLPPFVPGILTALHFTATGQVDPSSSQALEPTGGASSPLGDSGPWEIPPWLYIVLAAMLAALYSYVFPKLQNWMENRGK